MLQRAVCISMGIFLFIYAALDVKKRKVPVWPAVLCGIILAVYCAVRRESTAAVLFGGVAVGMGMLLLGVVTRGQIGAGDGMMFCLTGLVLGFPQNFYVLVCSLILAAMAAVYCLVFKKCGRKYSIPFIPFIFLGYVAVILGDGGLIR